MSKREFGLALILSVLIIRGVNGAEFNYTIPDEKLDEYVSDYLYIYPNNQTIPNPEYIDEETTPEIPPEILLYTDAQFVKQHIKGYIIDRIKLGKQRKVRDTYIETEIEDIE